MYGEIFRTSDEISGDYQLKYNYDGYNPVVYNCLHGIAQCKELPEEAYKINANLLTIYPDAVIRGIVQPGWLAVVSSDLPVIEFDKTLGGEKTAVLLVPLERAKNVRIKPVEVGGYILTSELLIRRVGDAEFLPELFLQEVTGGLLVEVKVVATPATLQQAEPGVFPVVTLDIEYEEW